MVAESVRWADVAATAREHGGPLFESLDYRDAYRDPERLGGDKKSLLFSIALRSSDGTLTSKQADERPRPDRRRVPREARRGVESVRRLDP